MHLPIKVKSFNNISMGINSAFKGLTGELALEGAMNLSQNTTG
jgi:hypothetical protein